MPRISPYLKNPANGWLHDLPAPAEVPETKKTQRATENPINNINEHFLEIPSPTMTFRGFIILAGLANLMAVGGGLWTVRSLFTMPSDLPVGVIIFLLLAVIGAVWGSIAVIRLDLSLPRDEPIRFNRSRQKVYIYHFRYSWLRPLSKTEWGVEVSVHDWDELWLEACGAYGSLEYGGSIQRVQISPQKDRTSDKRYSRVFSHSIRTGEAYWALIRLFMQQGRQALPPFKNPPPPREDEEMFYNVFWAYAPKVQWPKDIDIESRSAAGHTKYSEGSANA